MFLIKNEVEKLISYKNDEDVIKSEDIDAVCTVQITNHIFDMIDAIGQRQQKKALDLYYDLLALKEPPFRILSLITRQFNLLLQIKELVLKNAGRSEITSKVSVPPYFINKYISQAAQFDMKVLKKALEACGRADEEIKMGNIKDGIAVELLIAEFPVMQ